MLSMWFSQVVTAWPAIIDIPKTWNSAHAKRILYYNRIIYPLLLSHNIIANTKPNTCNSIMNISLVTLYHTALFSGFHAITMFEWRKCVVVIWFVNMSEKLAVSLLQQQKWQHTQSPCLQHQNTEQWRKYEASIYLKGGVSECRQDNVYCIWILTALSHFTVQTGYLSQNFGYLVYHTTCSVRTFTYKLKTTNSLLPPFVLWIS